MRIAGREDVDLFAAVSGDANPVHLDATFASTGICGHIVPHGMWSAALVSAVLGTKLPGPGTVYLGQEVRFLKPFAPGDTITASVTVREKRPADRVVVLDSACTNQNGEQVLTGTAIVIAPSTSIEWPRTRLPDAALRRQNRYEAFVKQASSLPPITAAIIHPCSPEAIIAAVEARDQGLFIPLLVGPEDKIRAAADKAQVDPSGIAVEPVPHSHAAAARGVELAVAGKVSVLVKGSLIPTNCSGPWSRPARVSGRKGGSATSMRWTCPPMPSRLSSPTRPSTSSRRSAVETVNPDMPATLDAAALAVMAVRGQITGAKVDGPLAFDNAISLDAARTKGIVSAVAGAADILLVPDLEAGNMLAKQLIYFAGATAAGLVLGARVPIVLTSRSDPLSARIASAALARLVVTRRTPAEAATS